MNYRRPELADRLAAEYVLGTLRGLARRRFARLSAGDRMLSDAIHAWEDRLLPLAEQLRPVTPPARVWEAIRARLGFAADAASSTPPATASWWSSLAAWRALALASLAAVIVLIALQLAPQREVAPSYVAVLSDQAAAPVFVVTSDADRRSISIRLVTPPSVAADRTLELWSLPAGGAPASLGVIPREGRIRIPLSGEAQERLRNAQALAVSVEPAGGSPTGAPTGPVLYKGAWVQGY